MTYHIGIDPGITGAIAILGAGLNAYVFPTPRIGKVYDERAMAQRLSAYERGAFTPGQAVAVAIIEAAQAFPGQGRTSCFSYGVGVGLWRGMLAAYCIGYTVIRPRAWQTVMLAGLTKSDTKAASIVAASRLFPNVDLRRTEKCKKPDHGMSDALLIAEYGRRMHCGETR